MAVKRVGNVRPPDHMSNIWNATPDILPGDVLSGAPGYGGQELREAPGPVITEEHMVVVESPKKPPRRPRKPSTRITEAVLERKRKPKIKAAPTRKNINLRIPLDVLDKFMEPGPGYQSRIVSVLRNFLNAGGKFAEKPRNSPSKKGG